MEISQALEVGDLSWNLSSAIYSLRTNRAKYMTFLGLVSTLQSREVL